MKLAAAAIRPLISLGISSAVAATALVGAPAARRLRPKVPTGIPGR